jgi:hypothetical protein
MLEDLEFFEDLSTLLVIETVFLSFTGVEA